jgi:hypothetical protein
MIGVSIFIKVGEPIPRWMAIKSIVIILGKVFVGKFHIVFRVSRVEINFKFIITDRHSMKTFREYIW